MMMLTRILNPPNYKANYLPSLTLWNTKFWERNDLMDMKLLVELQIYIESINISFSEEDTDTKFE